MLLIRRILRRLSAEHGFTMIAALGGMTAAMALGVAAFAAAGGDLRGSRYNQDEKRAIAAAEAGLNNYMFHLTQDNAYWQKCTSVPSPNAVNQEWNGVGTDPRTRMNVPGSNAQYTIELLPANGQSACSTASPRASMIDTTSQTFRIRSTGFSRNAKRALIGTFKRRGFLDYLYFTDVEVTDPLLTPVITTNDATRSGTSPSWSGPTFEQWRAQYCAGYERNGRSGYTFTGQIYDNGSWQAFTATCDWQIFTNSDEIAGPLHTNDEILVCGSPDFGRAGENDTISVSGSGWTGSSGCNTNNPDFRGPFDSHAPLIQLPTTDSYLKAIVDPGYLFTGKTYIVLGANNMTVNGQTMAYPPSGVLYVQNGTCGVPYNPLDPYTTPAGCADVYVHGSYGHDLTIASEKDIIVDGDLVHTNDALLGLIADNFVRIYHPVKNLSVKPNNITCSNDPAAPQMNNVTVDAAMLALNHSFLVDYYFCGPAMGDLHVTGSIGMRYRGPVGKGGSSINDGYTKKYFYDARLRDRSPPHFLDPVQSSWRIQRIYEQTAPK